MKLHRLWIIHSGNPPYVPNWSLNKHMIAGWHFTIISKERYEENKKIEAYWKN